MQAISLPPEEADYHTDAIHDCDEMFVQAHDMSDLLDHPDPCALPTPQSITLPPLDAVIPATPPPESPAPLPLRSLFLEVCSVEKYCQLINSSTPPPDRAAHIDGGSMATTTSMLDLLYYYHEYTVMEWFQVPSLRVANEHTHQPIGYGYLHVPLQSPNAHIFIKAYCTPEIPAKILLPDAVALAYGCRGYLTCSEFYEDTCYVKLRPC